jgi:hypothetical protein
MATPSVVGAKVMVTLSPVPTLEHVVGPGVHLIVCQAAPSLLESEKFLVLATVAV